MAIQIVTKEKAYRLSFVHLAKPDKFGKYSVSLLVPKEDTEFVEQLMAARKTATDDALIGKWSGKAPKDDGFPVTDGDTSDYESDNGCWVVRCNSTDPVPVYDNAGMPLNPEEVYSGCYAKVAMSVSGYNWENTKKGVGIYLNAVMKDADGERLGGVDVSPSVFGVTAPSSPGNAVFGESAAVETEVPQTPANPFGAKL